MKIVKKHLSLIASSVFLFLSSLSLVFAQEGQAPNIKLVNPLGSTKTLPQLVDGILRIVLTIGIPIVALAIIYSGFKLIMAQGKPKELEDARRALLYTIIGAGILLGAYVIAEAVVGTVNAIRA